MNVVEVLLVLDEDDPSEPPVFLALDVDDLEAIADVEGADVLRRAADGSVEWERASTVAAVLASIADQIDAPATAERFRASADALRAQGEAWVVASPVVSPQAPALDTRYNPDELAALLSIIDEEEHALAALSAFDSEATTDDRLLSGLASLIDRGIVADDGDDFVVAEPHATLALALTSPAIALTVVGLTPSETVNVTARITGEWAVFTDIDDHDGGVDLLMTLLDPSDALAVVLATTGAADAPAPAGRSVHTLELIVDEDGRSHPDLSGLPLELAAVWSVECRWIDEETMSGDTVDWFDAGEGGLYLVDLPTDSPRATLRPVEVGDVGDAILAMLPGD